MLRTKTTEQQSSVPVGCIKMKLIYQTPDGETKEGWFTIPLTEYRELKPTICSD